MAGKDDKKAAKSALRKVAGKVTVDKLKELGLSKSELGQAAAKAAAVAETARTGKIKGSVKVGKNKRLSGSYDHKKKAIELGYTVDFP